MTALFDLHTHSLHSDGELLPAELIRRAAVLGYTTLAITDHVDASNIGTVIGGLEQVREEAAAFGVDLICGVEITHVPPSLIPALARRARFEGAELIIVHGETVVEPVAPGTNLAACTCPDVHILAHPGFITTEEAGAAAAHGVALEITARGGHNRTNGHVLGIARAAGCRLVVNSDAHAPGDIMTEKAREDVARGAGMTSEECSAAFTLDVRSWLGKE
jgi:histidinol phosphatase-like PHP family hydrolase